MALSAYQKAIAKKRAAARAPRPPPRSVSKAAQDAAKRSAGLSRANAARQARKRGAANRAWYAAMAKSGLPAATIRQMAADRAAKEIAVKNAAKAEAKRQEALAYQRTLKKAQARFDAAFEAERQHKLRSSRQTAQSRAIQEREARALGTLKGTAQKGAPLVIGSAYAAARKDVAKKAAAEEKRIEQKVGTAYSLEIPETLGLREGLTGELTTKAVVTKEKPIEQVRGIKPTTTLYTPSGATYQVLAPTPEKVGPLRPPPPPEPVKEFLLGALASARAIGSAAVQAITGPPPIQILGAVTLSKLGITDEPLKAVIKRAQLSQTITEKIAPDPTLLGATVEQVIEGKPLTGTGRGFYYDVGSAAADVLLIAGPIKKIPLPRIQTVAPAGQKLATTISLGIGTKSKIIATKVIGKKIVLGRPKTYKPGSISAEPITATQQLRGTKLQADRPQVEQQLLGELAAVKAVKGITPKAIARAEVMTNIIKIGSKSKDPIQPGFKFPKQTFKDISATEQPSLFKSFAKQQRQISRCLVTRLLTRQYVTGQRRLR